MRTTMWNVSLAILWACMTGSLTPANLLVGFVLGYVVLLTTEGRQAIGHALRRVQRVASLLLFFVWELALANLRVAWDVVTPRHRMRPGVIAVPLEARTDVEITLLANMVSLTPGTLSLDVSDDRSVLYVHAMYVHDRDRLVQSIRGGFERRLMEVLR